MYFFFILDEVIKRPNLIVSINHEHKTADKGNARIRSNAANAVKRP